MTSLSLKNICSILEHNVDNELLLKYIPSINAPIVSNQSEFQSMLINMLDSYRPILSHRRIERKAGKDSERPGFIKTTCYLKTLHN